jgi:3',5'-cyclic AMP phosphodiesterase CpdA
VYLTTTGITKCAAVLCGAALILSAEDGAGPAPYRFAVIGDSGTGGKGQYDVGARLAEQREQLAFDAVLMLGDNIYGSGSAKNFRAKFERPFAKLLGAGVRFYAALGNHDAPSQRDYEHFHMGGRSYYSFAPHPDVRFFALDSNRVDRTQLEWLERELESCKSAWKIAYLHHPLYSSGARHGSSVELRGLLEPLLVKHGVSVVLAGHDHFYERITPQRGVHHFVVGGSAKVRVGYVRHTGMTESSYDRDRSFLLMEADGRELRFKAISRTGSVIDEGAIRR